MHQLHLDETTPHIHATLVAIVTGERRKAKDEAVKNTGKKKYKKGFHSCSLSALAPSTKWNACG
ncbi:hypothetical protein [Proteiniphilum sp. UBA5384]|uniref:hypothetical protein n=1 Tax=Proteiniphilum sp. UBA5384 TaxID=1947279 RepID=UPI0025FCFC2B|nr:hypothetical protein [Proteiniphilum sp. UBA5384]